MLVSQMQYNPKKIKEVLLRKYHKNYIKKASFLNWHIIEK
jgi:hypothetical protein